MNILQISTYDRVGGAAQIAWNLAQSYRRLGHPTRLVVGHASAEHPDTFALERDAPRGAWSAFWMTLYRRLDEARGRIKGAGHLANASLYLARTDRRNAFRCGIEDFAYPDSHRILELVGAVPDLVHCHNLHGEYFDLEVLPALSRKVPTILTLHDQWLFTGHCAYTVDCRKWEDGCGSCPDLKRYPAIGFDRTAENWLRKGEILGRAKLYVATPSRWLLAQVDRSILGPGVVEKKCIPNGVDLTQFHPADLREARAELEVPVDSDVLLFVAQSGSLNPYKDLGTVRDAVERLARVPRARPLVLLALGEARAPEKIGHAEVRYVPFEHDTKRVARYYQACDVYLHGALTDNFPQVILEAFACAKPVVASNVGGIPEQVRDWRAGADGNGALVPVRDSAAMAEAVTALLDERDLRSRLGARAADDAKNLYDLNLQTKRYLEWYARLARPAEPNAPATTRTRPAVATRK